METHSSGESFARKIRAPNVLTGRTTMKSVSKLLAGVATLTLPGLALAQAVTINEFHYDNSGADTNEFVELAGPVGTSLDGWQLVLYNGSSSIRAPYATFTFTAADTLAEDASNPGAEGYFVQATVGLQNGSPDGIALVDPSGSVIEFLSYEGSFVALSGPAQGMTSVDIGVSESSSTPIGSSLQRINGTFSGPSTATPGAANGDPAAPVLISINEFHYDNAGRDTGEFVELTGPAGSSLAEWQLVLYNGSSSVRAPYNTFTFDSSDILVVDPANPGSEGYFVQATVGLQNGSPDGIALVDPSGNVVEFLSYEGRFEALSGPAQGLTSVDVGVAEGSSTPVGSSLQRINGTFSGPHPATPGAANVGTTVVVRTIMAIQGAGHTSADAGSAVETSGIVTAVGSFDAVGRSDETGFYIQDPIGDGDSATSDAIFVASNQAVNVGDAVTVQGIVEESGFFQELTYTRINNVSSVTINSSSNPLPDAVVLGQGGRIPPTESIDDDAFTTFEPNADGVDFFESLEGMRVVVQDAVAVSATSRFGEIFVVVDQGASATGLSDRGTLNISPDDFNPEKIQIDVGRERFDPNNFDLPVVRVGARLGDITGIVGYDFGNFQVQPDELGTVEDGTLSPEVTILGKSAHDVLVASYNVLNLDPNDNDGDTDLANGRFAVLAEHVVHHLKSPDVIGLQEIQDNSGSTNDGVVAADLTLQTLVDAIALIGGPNYTFIDNTFITNNNSGGQPGANIRTAFLYNADRVDLVPGSVRTVSNVSAFAGARLPLIASFSFRDETFTVVVNHFSSKGGSAPIFGTAQPFEARQEDVNVNGSLDERQAQSAEVRVFIDEQLDSDPDTRLIVLGDLNEFEFVSPVSVNLGGALENLTFREPDTERYSFNFQGNSQSLDHILVSPALSDRAEFDIVHVNSEFPSLPSTGSDHDPLVAQISFRAPAPLCEGRTASIYVEDGLVVGGPLHGETYAGILMGTSNIDVIVGTPDYDMIIGGEAEDTICGLGGDDVLFGGPSSDRLYGGEGTDVLMGEGGDDLLDGGAAEDVCDGGEGENIILSCEA